MKQYYGLQESTDTANKRRQLEVQQRNCTGSEETAGGTRISTMEISGNYCNREGIPFYFKV